VKKCPCHSGKSYQECCAPLHSGELAPTAVALMRSRYAAYALGLSDYIMDTTHPDSPAYTVDRERWRSELDAFSRSTAFEGLQIVASDEGLAEAIVTFTAFLKQGKQDASFTEKSLFCRLNGGWIYSRATE
jgi:SEC-C motif-containing protein